MNDDQIRDNPKLYIFKGAVSLLSQIQGTGEIVDTGRDLQRTAHSVLAVLCAQNADLTDGEDTDEGCPGIVSRACEGDDAGRDDRSEPRLGKPMKDYSYVYVLQSEVDLNRH